MKINYTLFFIPSRTSLQRVLKLLLKLGSDSVYVTFDPYKGSQGVAGSLHVLVPYDVVDSYIYEESPINRIR